MNTFAAQGWQESGVYAAAVFLSFKEVTFVHVVVVCVVKIVVVVIMMMVVMYEHKVFLHIDYLVATRY